MTRSFEDRVFLWLVRCRQQCNIQHIIWIDPQKVVQQQKSNDGQVW